jgi:hypothetical protein
MKLSFLFLSLVSFPVLACPNLAGVYKVCRSSTEQNTISNITVEQKIVNKYYQYTFTIRESDGREVRIEKYTADGKTKIVSDTDADTGITIKTETLTSCQDNVLNIKMNATLDSEAFADVTIKATKNGNQLTQVFSGVSMDEPVNDTIFCE